MMNVACKQHTPMMMMMMPNFRWRQLVAITSSRQLRLLIVASFILLPSFAFINCSSETHSDTNSIRINDNHHHHNHHHYRHHPHLHSHHHKEHLHDNSHHHQHYDHRHERGGREDEQEHGQQQRQLVASNDQLIRPTTNADQYHYNTKYQFRNKDRGHHLHHSRRARRHHERNCCQDHERRHRQQDDTAALTPPASETFERALASNRFKLTKREALDMVVNRLHILESLDDQLRAFTEAAALAQQNQLNHRYRADQQHQANQQHNSTSDGQAEDNNYGKQIYCHLELVRSSSSSSGLFELPDTGADLDIVSPLAAGHYLSQSMGSCLRSKNLLNQVPPYMLNLYRQLLYELHEQQQRQQQQNVSSSSNFSTASDAAAAVQLISTMMPYKAQIMRSFRQPKIYLPNGLPIVSASSSSNTAQSQYNQEIPNSTPTLGNYVQGRSNLQWTDNGDEGTEGTRGQDDESVLGNVVVELNVLAGQQQEGPARPLQASLGRPEIDGNRRHNWTPTTTAAADNLIETSDEPREEELSHVQGTSKDRFGPKSSSNSNLPANGNNHNSNNNNNSDGLNRKRRHRPAMACSLKQRLLPAHKRDELCFWFNLGDNFHSATLAGNDTLEFSIGGGGSGRLNGDTNSVRGRGQARQERLIEAELHVFKLFPQLLPTSEQVAGGTDLAQADAKTLANNNRTAAPTTSSSTNNAANLYHLKTNLLEVNLYQILPRRRTTKAPMGSSSGANELGKQQQQRQKWRRKADDGDHEPKRDHYTGGGGGRGGETAAAASDQVDQDEDEGEYPLRLLDIRRIDLNSNGWETFYVKRAVQDWLRDARLNLGLVIKAKSMFDEPIKIGLIRFADAYDHYAYYKSRSSSSSKGNTSHHQFEATLAARSATDHIRPDGPGGFASRSPGQSEAAPSASEDERRHTKAMHDFDSSHQPLLVIYTNAVQIDTST